MQAMRGAHKATPGGPGGPEFRTGISTLEMQRTLLAGEFDGIASLTAAVEANLGIAIFVSRTRTADENAQ